MACLRSRDETSESSAWKAEGSEGGLNGGGVEVRGALPDSHGRRNPDLITWMAHWLAGKFSHSGRCLERLPAKLVWAGDTVRSGVSHWGWGLRAAPRDWKPGWR